MIRWFRRMFNSPYRLRQLIQDYGNARWQSGLEMGRAEAEGKAYFYVGGTVLGGHGPDILQTVRGASDAGQADTDAWKEAHQRACNAYGDLVRLLGEVDSVTPYRDPSGRYVLLSGTLPIEVFRRLSGRIEYNEACEVSVTYASEAEAMADLEAARGTVDSNRNGALCNPQPGALRPDLPVSTGKE